MDKQKTGEFIRSLRKENNITQLELAQKLSCTDKAISRWETGKGFPDVDMLLSLSEVFGVSVNEILLGERFGFSQLSAEATSDEKEDNSSIEKVLLHTDEAIVDILKDKEKEIGKINRSVICLIASCCIQVLLMFGLPKLGNYFDFDSLNIFLSGTLVNYIFAGFIKDKCKWYFPGFVAVLWLFSDDYPGFMVTHALLFGGISLLIMAVVSGVIRMIKRVSQRTD